jgi:hypothetical protein
MSKADTNNSFQALSDRFDVIDMIATSGWTGPITFEQREAIIQSVVLNEMIYKKRVAIAQIREGLSILDILKITQDNPATMKPLFVSDDSPLTLKRLRELLIVDETRSAEEKWADEFFQQMLADNIEIVVGEGTVNIVINSCYRV